MSVETRIASPKDPQATKLLEASHALLQELFSNEENHFLNINDLCVPSIRFLVAEEDGVLLGCAALARKDSYGELKSMFVSPKARNKGVASALMTHLEQIAKDDGITLLQLETGNILHAAHRVYERHGFTLRGPFAEYADIEASVFYEKALT